MTTPSNWDGRPNPVPIHTPPPAVRSIARLTPRQLGAYGTVLVDLILAQVALALAGVNVFGVQPFAFLKGWADQLQLDAQKAYLVAAGVSDGINQAVTGTKPAASTQTDYIAAYNAAVSQVGSVKSTASTADGKAQGAIDGINQAVTGATGTGATAGTVFSNISTVKNTATGAAGDASVSLTKHSNLLTSLRGGYTIDIVNTTSTWNKPSGLSEIFVVCFGGGAKGSNGQRGTTATAQPGGDPGAVIAVQLDPKDVPATVSCTIGGNTSATPSKTSFGTLVTTDDAYGGYVATPLGVILTGASPSKGGSGGLSSGNGASGATTTVGLTGGAGGSFNATGNAFPGSAGKTGLVFAGNLCQTGGSGGGGGGGTSNNGFVGGNGGQGGFPGGGGGGGGNGAGSSPATSTGGNGGLGLIMVIYKLATNT